MKNLLVGALACTLWLVPVVARAKAASEDAAVIKSLVAYHDALQRGDGKDAVRWSTGKTVAFYDDVREQALHASASDVRKLSPMSKLTVLMVREYKYADDPTKSYTTTWFDTWRFVDGKADEHWDPATLPAPPPPAASAPAARPDSVLAGTLEDRAAIEKLMWSYDRALDSYNPDAYVTKFTADGAFGRTAGREALHKLVADLRKGRDDRIAKGEKVPAMRHFTMNQFLEFTSPTTARYHYYHQTVFGTGGAAGSPDAPRVAASGNGVDDLVKVNGQWLIKYRNVAATDDL